MVRLHLVRVAALALVVAACATSTANAPSASPEGRQPPAQPKAFIWEAKKGDAVVHIVGSVHFGRDGATQPPPSMTAAYDASEVVVVELDVTRQDPAAIQKLVAAKGFYRPEERGLFAQLSDPHREKLQKIATDAGMDAQRMDRMRPWLANMMVAVLELMAKRKGVPAGESATPTPKPADTGGFDPKQGIDYQFISRAHADGKAIVELETADAQLSALASLPEPDQLAVLEQLLATGKPIATEVAVVAMDTWARGDADQLDRQLLGPVRAKGMEAFYKTVFVDRNLRMTERIVELASLPKRHFVVVGAGHVVGPEGILQLLERRGFTVKQLPRE